MAEYVNTIFIARMLEAITDDKELIANTMDSLPIADVIERSKVDEVIKEMKDKSFKHYFQFGEYIDEDVRQLEVIELKDVLEILKRNIGE